jgi:hypothetical protein
MDLARVSHWRCVTGVFVGTILYFCVLLRLGALKVAPPNHVDSKTMEGQINVTSCEGFETRDDAQLAWQGLLDMVAHAPSARDSSRGLFAVAAGESAIPTLEIVIPWVLSSPVMDVVVLSYDNYGWTDAVSQAWSSNTRVKIVLWSTVGSNTTAPTKYVFASRYLNPLPSQYSHVFLWDSDILPVGGWDIGSVLRLLQATPHIQVATPLVQYSNVSDCHYGRWIHKSTPAHAYSGIVEIMLPVYTAAIWPCIRSLVKEQYPDVWGMDISGHYCNCGADLFTGGQVILPMVQVVHSNTRSRRNNSTTDRIDKEAIKGWKLMEQEYIQQTGDVNCRKRARAVHAVFYKKRKGSGTPFCFAPVQ